jgi:PEP-CTERM motif
MIRLINFVIALLTFVLVSFAAPTVKADPLVLYGGNGGHSNGDSVNDGALVVVNQNTATVTLVGHPANVARLSGIVFASNNILYGTTLGAGGFPPPPGPVTSSQLITINPETGALASTIGTITAGGQPIAIADLAIQPGTGVLYGIRSPADQLNGQGKLYTINTSTGVATLVGDTGAFFGSIAFAPNGTLYMSAANLDFMTDEQINLRLLTLNPNNAAVLSSVPTDSFYGALGIRPTDAVIFGGTGDQHQLFTINPTTGAAVLIGDTGGNFIGDLDFRPAEVPEPATFVLLGTGLACLTGAVQRRKMRR